MIGSQVRHSGGGAMALMPRSKGKDKGPARKTKGFKKQGFLKPKATAAKRKTKRKDGRYGVGDGDTAMLAEPTQKRKGGGVPPKDLQIGDHAMCCCRSWTRSMASEDQFQLRAES